MNLQSHRHPKLLICYCHKDAEGPDRLRISLRPLIQKQKVDIWDDTMIIPGSNWLADKNYSITSPKLFCL